MEDYCILKVNSYMIIRQEGNKAKKSVIIRMIVK